MAIRHPLMSLVVAVAPLLSAGGVLAEDGGQALLDRILGKFARLDPATVAKARALRKHKRLRLDTNGDGKHDEVWFLDTAHRNTIRPILVRAIDEDGDLAATRGRPDFDSDLILVDHKADGTIDAFTDFIDTDGDGDADQMIVGQFTGPARDALRISWATDLDDSNLLLHTVNGIYDPQRCQYRSRFAGDLAFHSFVLRGIAPAAPDSSFLFYDPDKDGAAEVAVAFVGQGDALRAMRYSLDADGDAWGRRPYDYDLSITAIAATHPWLRGKAPNTQAVKPTDAASFAATLRGIPTERLVRWDAARTFAQQAPWALACLTWDEMNANTEANAARDPHERWEGVINPASDRFPQVGGPPTGPLNKRIEVAAPAHPLRLYHDPTDHRLHLLGAGVATGWLDVDYDLDGKADARYTWTDDNRDGIFDRRTLDLDADGTPEFEWKMKGQGARTFALDHAPLQAFYTRELATVLADSQRFIDAARDALGNRVLDFGPVEAFFVTKLAAWQPTTRLGHRVRSTPAGARLYVDLVRDRMLHALKGAFGTHAVWPRVEAAYSAGDYAAAGGLVFGNLAPPAGVGPPTRFAGLHRRIAVRIDNTGGPRREAWPIVLRVKALRRAASDFNPDNCAVVAPERWLDWREVPHQVDQIDPAAGQEISFLADVPGDATTVYIIRYSARGTRKMAFPAKTATAEDWVPPNIGWESTWGGYRAYWGQFDYFGKKQYTDAGRKAEWLIYPSVKGAYHSERAWGIDALHVGTTSGLGGLTLYVGERPFAVQNPAGKGTVKFTKRMLTAGPVRAAIEFTAANVVPGKSDLVVRVLCIIYAEHLESEIRVTATGADATMHIAPGLCKLPLEKAFVDRTTGCLGAWGFQEHAIGDVGVGLIVPPAKLRDVADLRRERRLRCAFADGRLRYWIVGDWRLDRRFPVAPTLANWRRDLTALAARLTHDVRITLAPTNGNSSAE